MRVALIPLRTVPRQPATNLGRLVEILAQFEEQPVDLICLPECTLTGYLYTESDLATFAEPIPGPTTEKMGQLARRLRSYLCFGMLERQTSGFYNTAILLDPQGQIRLQHRKIVESPPFLCGKKVLCAQTEWGRMGLLICGDLFSEQLVAQVSGCADLLLVPMARSLEGRSPDFERWVNEERDAYLEAVSKARVLTLLVNAFEEDGEEAAFGGAMVISPQGTLLAESPHGSDQILVWESAPGDEKISG